MCFRGISGGICALLLAALLAGCGVGTVVSVQPPDNKPDIFGQLSLGTTETLLVSGTLPAAGGSLVVRQEDSPLDGMTLSAAKGVFPTSTSLTVYSRPITAHTFGSAVQPISPLITLDDGGRPAEGFVRVTIPISLPAGQSALALSYNRTTGRLLVLTPLAQSTSALTVAVTTFSPPVLMDATPPQTSVDLFVTAVPALPDALDSGFRPGIDNWQFPNDGTSVTTGGQCLGASITADYYFQVRKPLQQQMLYGRFDDSDGGLATPYLWRDDTRALRLVAVAQRSQDQMWTAFLDQAGSAVGAQGPALSWLACKYALYLSHQPQLLSLYDAANRQHAVVVYRVDGHTLFFADPYFPDRSNATTTLSGTFFTPYEGYTNFLFLSQHAVDWTAIRQLWAEFDAGTIGADIFPTTSLQWRNPGGVWSNLNSGEAQPLTNTFEVRAMVNGSTNAGWLAFGEDGIAIDSTVVTPAAVRAYTLRGDATPLGINVLVSDGHGGWSWADFHWITVAPLTSFTIEAAATTVTAGVTLTLNAVGRDIHGHAVPIPDANITWTTDNPEFATVDPNGNVVTLNLITMNAGSTTVTAVESITGRRVTWVVAVNARKPARP